MIDFAKRQKLMAENPPEIDAIHYGDIYFDWAWKGCGFGQLDIHFDKEAGTIHVANECMSRERVRSILISLANHIADKAVLDDEPHPKEEE